jgi:hypothetical protein
MKRFSVVKENAKWMVFDALERTHVWEGRTRQEARNFADAKNRKEKLRTAEIVSMEPLSEYLARQKKEEEARE